MASILTALLVMFLAAVLASGCANEQEMLDANKARVTQLLVQNSQLREFLENNVYELGDNVIITTPDGFGYDDKAAVMLINGKLSIPVGLNPELTKAVARYEQQITAIFRTFHCLTISLRADGHGRTAMALIFDNIKINDEHYHAQSLIYSPGAAVDGDSVFKDWYYSTLGYT